MVATELSVWLNDQQHGQIQHREPVAGGSICHAERLVTDKGRHFFLKTHNAPPRRLFPAEAEGLRALRETGAIRVPAVHWVTERLLLLEYIAPGQPGRDYWAQFGRQLAQMHQRTMPWFGFTEDNYCGETPQINHWCDDGYQFFAEHRLLFQAQRALNRGYLNGKEVARIEALAARLPDLIPEQPPSLLHGDLWSGNAHCDGDGQPVLLDPAAHWGWAEAELAMTQLFGGFPDGFYAAYEETRPLAPGWRRRVPLYNLYHLLNHLNLFGSSYYRQVMAVLDRFG